MRANNLITKALTYVALSSVFKTAIAVGPLVYVTGELNSEFIKVLGIERALFDETKLHLILHTESQNFTENEELLRTFFDSTNARTMSVGKEKDTDLMTPSQFYGREKFNYDNSTNADVRGAYAGPPMPRRLDHVKATLSSSTRCGRDVIWEGNIEHDSCVSVGPEAKTLAFTNWEEHSVHVMIYNTPDKCQGEMLDHWIQTPMIDCITGPNGEFWIGPPRYNEAFELRVQG